MSGAVPRAWWIAVAAIVLVGAIVRVLAAGGDMWFDEIWSWKLAVNAESPMAIYRYAHDNNHLLNSLWVWLVGDTDNHLLYRLPPLVTGITLVALLAIAAAKYGRVAALIAALLGAASSVLVQYSIEARGYGIAAMCSVLAFVLLERFHDKPKLATAITFGLTSCIGLFGHLSFVLVYAALFVWFVARRTSVADLLRCHTLPILVSGLLYFTYVRQMEIGGGPILSKGSVFLEAVSYTFGFRGTNPFAAIACIAVLVIVVAACVRLARRTEPRWMFGGLVLVITPFLVLVVLRPEFLYVRYLLVTLPFLVLFVSIELTAWWNAGTFGRVAAAVVVVVSLAMNAMHVSQLITTGPGQYEAAIDFMREKTQGEVVVASDHDVRNLSLVEFYIRNEAPKRTEYLTNEVVQQRMPEWYILHAIEPEYVPPPSFTAGGKTFQLQKTFEYAGLSGWNWFVYRR